MKKIFHKSIIFMAIITLIIGCFGCNNTSSHKDSTPSVDSNDSNNSMGNQENSDNEGETATNSAHIDILAPLTDKDKLTDYDDDVTTITLSNNKISADNNSVTISGNVATITQKGDYIITGTIDDGQIIVDSDKEKDVHIIMDNASITSKKSAPIHIKSADKVILTLKDGTDNYLSDSSSFEYENAADEEPNATLFSKDSLTINGEGSLTVNAEFNNGIQSKDHLKIVSGNITVTSKNDGIKGKDSLTITGGTINVTSDGDALDSNNAEEEGCGYIHISEGKLTLNSEGKGIKAQSLIYINGGTIDINSTDDAINCTNDVQIDDGEISIATKDDAIHGDLNVIVNDGKVNITECYEGLEGGNIIVNEGAVNISATDDGINVASSNSNNKMTNPMAGDSSCALTINGGFVYINCEGDGLDSNGTVIMNGGVAIVEGPTFSANGALDYGISFTLNGGYLIAMGASGMAENVSASSTQCSALLNFSGNLSDVRVTITDSDNNVLISYTAAKTWGSITFSTPDMAEGETYSIYINGELENSTNIGSTAYIGGTLSNGELLGTYTQDSIVYGSGMGGMGGGPGGHPNGGMGGPGGHGNWR